MLPPHRRLRFWLPMAAAGFAMGYAVPDSWRMAWVGAAAARDETTAVIPAPTASPQALAAFATTVEPIFDTHCQDCHGDGMKKGGLDLDALATLTTTNPGGLKDVRAKWKSIRTHVASNLMPPADEDPLPDAEKSTLLAWIDQAIFPVDPNNPDPGQFTVRRLNRAEYTFTIRDLLGVTIDATTLPPDDSGYGFDNIGDVLSLAPAHLERYQEFAFDALARAFDPVTPDHRRPRNHGPDKFHGDGNANQSGGYRLSSPGAARLDFHVREPGRHQFVIEVSAEQAGPEPAAVDVQINGKWLRAITIHSPTGKHESHTIEHPLTAGKHTLSIVFTRDFWEPDAPGGKRDRNVIVHRVTSQGPLDGPPPPAPPARVRWLPEPEPGEAAADHARRVLEPFLARAFRRPITGDELGRYLSLAGSARESGESPESALRLAMEAALVAPDFLFRGLSVLRSSVAPGSIEAVPETDLASRLSYFLWSSMPDDRLLAMAEKGELRANLAGEVNRMLDDPKADALIDRFFLQWLQVLDIEVVQPDGRTFRRAFNSDVRQSMLAETRAFCRHLLRGNRPAVELLTAEYTFVDPNLRRLYGLPETDQDGFQKVDLKGTGRRGILTHGSILTVTSNPTRTSPVKRGKWVLENILDQPPPPPPPNVPSLESLADIPEDAPLRVKLEAHQADPACASCHKLMDGIGFSFEHFDGIGRWREKDGDRPIDPRGTLATGEAFASPEELIALLVAEKRAEFHRAVAAKMLTFALGRGLDYFDEPAVQSVVATAVKEDGRMRAFVHAVVQSFPFQNRRLPGPPSNQ